MLKKYTLLNVAIPIEVYLIRFVSVYTVLYLKSIIGYTAVLKQRNQVGVNDTCKRIGTFSTNNSANSKPYSKKCFNMSIRASWAYFRKNGGGGVWTSRYTVFLTTYPVVVYLRVAEPVVANLFLVGADPIPLSQKCPTSVLMTFFTYHHSCFFTFHILQ